MAKKCTSKNMFPNLINSILEISISNVFNWFFGFFLEINNTFLEIKLFFHVSFRQLLISCSFDDLNLFQSVCSYDVFFTTTERPSTTSGTSTTTTQAPLLNDTSENCLEIIICCEIVIMTLICLAWFNQFVLADSSQIAFGCNKVTLRHYGRQ
jgi:hypothetical protein